MTTYTSRDFLAAAQPRFEFLSEQKRLLEAEAQAYDDDIIRLNALHQRTRDELASYLLAEVGDDELGALQKRLRYPGLKSVKAEFERELRQSEAERVQLAAHPDVEHNAFHVGQARDDMASLQEAVESYRHRRVAWRASKWFTELDQRGFFDRDYAPDFFDHFWDWRAVSWLMDELEEDLELDLATPDTVRAHWVALVTESEPVLEAYRDLERRVAELTELKARHDELVKAPALIFQRMVKTLGEAVLDHLDSCPLPQKTQLAQKDPFLVTFFKKDAGLAKQLQYLRQLRTTRIVSVMQSIDAELNKLGRKTQKAQRKHKYFDEATILGMRDLKREKWSKRHAKLAKIRGRVAGFKHYEQGDFHEDYLWWDAMTRGAPADDIYEVRTFRRRNPHWDWRTHEDRWHSHRHEEPSRTAMDNAADELADRMQPAVGDDWDGDAS